MKKRIEMKKTTHTQKHFGTLAVAVTISVAVAMLSACTGRTADNMVPSGETVRVEIPASDVAQDSIIANGVEISDSINNYVN